MASAEQSNGNGIHRDPVCPMNGFLDPADEDPGSANPRVCINGDPRTWRELAHFAADVLVVVIRLAAPYVLGILALATAVGLFQNMCDVDIRKHGNSTIVSFRRKAKKA